MNVLIGSRALNYWIPEHSIKESTDWDVISDSPIDGCEFHDATFLNNDCMRKYATSDVLEFNGIEFQVMSLEGLAIIKRSHLWRELSFDKHITHFHRHLAPFLIKNQDYENRLRMSLNEFERGHPNLNQKVKDFFDDAVVKKYDHDWLHELFAHEDEPLYRKIQRDHSKAWCHRDLWEEFSHERKLQCIAEEAYVIATERFMVPNDWSYNMKRAYIAAVRKICTTLCSGFFRDYAIDHYPEVLGQFDLLKFTNVKLEILK